MGTVLPSVADAKYIRGNEKKKERKASISIRIEKLLVARLPTAVRPFDGAENVSFFQTPSQLC